MKQETIYPKFKTLGELPDTIMALIINMWERDLGKIPDQMNLIITYFDAIYVNAPIPPEMYAHELVHFYRQGSGQNQELANEFCLRYCKDKQFRYEEELLAYKEQYRYVKERGKLNRKKLFEYLKYLAKEMASEKYGNICTEMQALHAIIG